MISRTYRLQKTDIEMIEAIAEARGVTQAEAVRIAVRETAEGLRKAERQEAERSDAVDAALEALSAQLAVKDGQIAALGRALEAAQETAKAAQALHAMGQQKAELEDAPAHEERRTRWQRLKDAWRG